jgi:rare lipoprotein A (peptidoglycan hydrolase)
MPGASFLARAGVAPRARVCADGRCAIVRVVDACGCHVGTSSARLVDLSAATLDRLGLDASRGVYRVTVTLLGS